VISTEHTDHFNLNRFIEAQNSDFNKALDEIKQGKKRSHWMWFVFPQFKGLGSSSTSEMFAINSIAEAQAYIKQPILGPRLVEITLVLLNLESHSADSIFGSPDDLKLKSSMTLFNAVQNETNIFELTLDKYFFGTKCEKTLRYLSE
jgi:uncharacterized protein (DUF1810 family)